MDLKCLLNWSVIDKNSENKAKLELKITENTIYYSFQIKLYKMVNERKTSLHFHNFIFIYISRTLIHLS